MIKIYCFECNGTGRFSYSEHSPFCDGTCTHCPIEVQDPCSSCGGYGYKFISNLEYIRMVEMKEPIIEL